jgi:hypothetical protein
MDFYFLMYKPQSVTISNRLSYFYINLLSLTLHHLTEKDKLVSSSKLYLTQQIKIISEETKFINKTHRSLGKLLVFQQLSTYKSRETKKPTVNIRYLTKIQSSVFFILSKEKYILYVMYSFCVQ